MSNTYVTSPADLAILRPLAQRVREIARSDENLARKQRWHRHNALQPGQPMVLIEVGGLGGNNENPITPMLQCQEKWARDLEMSFRSSIYQFDVVKDDWVVEPYINYNWKVDPGSYGVKPKNTSGSHDGIMGSRIWEPPLKNLQEDFTMLQKRKFSVDREATLSWKKHLENTLGDILPVRMRGGYWWTMGMTWIAIDLIGLEQLMLYMIDDPQGLHRLMQFLHDDHLAFATWLEKEGLLSLNNENDYVGSGSVAYTKDLPKPDMNAHVRMQDTWVLSESQEDRRRRPRHVRRVHLSLPEIADREVRPLVLRLLRTRAQSLAHRQRPAQPAEGVGLALVRPGVHGPRTLRQIRLWPQAQPDAHQHRAL